MRAFFSSYNRNLVTYPTYVRGARHTLLRARGGVYIASSLLMLAHARASVGADLPSEGRLCACMYIRAGPE